MKKKRWQNNKYKRWLSIILICVFTVIGIFSHKENNANAEVEKEKQQSEVEKEDTFVSQEEETSQDEESDYILLQGRDDFQFTLDEYTVFWEYYEYDEWNGYGGFTVKKGEEEIFTIYEIDNALVYEKKIYYPYGRGIYCYDIEKNQDTLVTAVKKGTYYPEYGDVNVLFACYNSYLYYTVQVDVDYWDELYRVNLETGKQQKLHVGSFESYDFIYQGNIYIHDTSMDGPSNISYYQLSVQGDRIVKRKILTCGANAQLTFYKDKLYYVKYDERDLSKEMGREDTTYLMRCNLDGTEKEILQTWEKETVFFKHSTGTEIYIGSYENEEGYYYNMETGELTDYNEAKELTNVKVELCEEYNGCKVSFGGRRYEKYQISYATDANFSDERIVNASDNAKQEVIMANLTKGKTYYVRVKACTYNYMKGEDVETPYSEVQTITIS